MERDALPTGEVSAFDTQQPRRPSSAGTARCSGVDVDTSPLPVAPRARALRRRGAPLAALPLLAFLAASCATPGAPPPEPALVTEDVLPDLWRFWDAHRSDARPDQIRAFRATVIAAHSGLLGPEVFG